jgi:hypothetical protein
LNSMLFDTELRERIFERPPAERRLSERPTVERPTVERATAERTAAFERPGFLDLLAASGAVVVVGLGLAFVFVIAIVSLATVPDSQKAAVVTAAFTVLGTIVGAYFGVKVGAAGKQQAESARDAESVKVQELAARVNPETAVAALDSAHRRLERS